MSAIPNELREALTPFLFAASVGYCVEQDVRAAQPRQFSKHPLIAFAGYAGQYAAESRVSWAQWQRLLDVADKIGLLDKLDPESTLSSTGEG